MGILTMGIMTIHNRQKNGKWTYISFFFKRICCFLYFHISYEARSFCYISQVQGILRSIKFLCFLFFLAVLFFNCPLAVISCGAS